LKNNQSRTEDCDHQDYKVEFEFQSTGVLFNHVILFTSATRLEITEVKLHTNSMTSRN